MAKAAGLLQSIEAIYAAGLDGERWPDALASLAAATGSVGATLEVFRKSPLNLIEFAVAGLPVGAETAYLDHYARHNPRAAYAFEHLSQAFLADYQLIDEPGMDRDPYYAKYLTSIDLRYFLSGQIFNTADAQAVITIQRSRRQGHVDRAEIDSMRRLLPHFRRAYETATLLRGARAATASLEGALDWLADGAALVRSDGTLAYANDALRRFAAACDGVALTRNTVEFGASDARARLDNALAAVGCMAEGNAPSIVDFAVARPSGAPPYLVSVRPLVGPAAGGNAVAVVFVRDPLARSQSGTRLLREAFGLTGAEAELARELQMGVDPAAYARARSLSRNTVYTHLRRIKEKTGCTRLSALVARLNQARTPARPN